MHFSDYINLWSLAIWHVHILPILHWWHLRLLYCTIFSQYVHCSKCIKTYEITPSHATSIQITSRNTPHYYSGKIGHALMLIIRIEIKTSSHFSLLRSSYSGIGTSFLKEPFKSFTHLYKISSHCKPIDDLICNKQTTGACLTVGTTCNNRASTLGEWLCRSKMIANFLSALALEHNNKHG